MANVVCVGAQWGDEGKGKVVDLLAERADLIVRFQGGNNAGHTLVVDDVQTVLHLIPSGVLWKDKVCVIGNGCVIDPEVLLQELEMLEARGFGLTPERLVISDCAHVILPFHKRIDKARESARGDKRIGTTGRGIGPAYEDKSARRGMRMHDLVRPTAVSRHLRDTVMYANSLLEALDAEPYSGQALEELIGRTQRHGEQLKPFVADAGEHIADAVTAGKIVLFEGAQGAMLDLDHGTYPYVTSSNASAGQAAVGSGVGPRYLDRVVCVAKAYTTRVGEGPFPTELSDAVGEQLRKAGHEFGATTGRSRRCGWLDLVQLRAAMRMNSASHLALTKLDVLAEVDPIQVCTHYLLDGEPLHSFPHDSDTLSRVVPQYTELPGFEKLPETLGSLDELPPNARRYVDFVCDELRVPLALLGCGPGRKQAVILQDVMAA